MTRALAFVVPVIAAVSGYTVLVRAALPQVPSTTWATTVGHGARARRVHGHRVVTARS